MTEIPRLSNILRLGTHEIPPTFLPTPIDLASDFTMLCTELDQPMDPTINRKKRREYDLLRDQRLKQLNNLIRHHVPATEHGLAALSADIARCATGVTTLPFSGLLELTEIDIEEKRPGIFNLEGARKYEEQQLLVYGRSAIIRAQRQQQDPETIGALIASYENWIAVYCKHYDVPDTGIPFPRFGNFPHNYPLSGPRHSFYNRF